MDLRLFFKKDTEEETMEYGASSLFKDKNGEKIKWTLRKLTVDEAEKIRNDSLKISTVNGKPVTKFDTTSYNRKIAIASVVEPNLNNAELQDSYGVKRAEDLITQLFDGIGEYDAFINKIAEFSRIKTVEEDIEESKN